MQPSVSADRRSSRSTRLVTVDQRPIGRTPRSNLATYTGLFDAVRKAVRRDRRRPASAAMTRADSPSTSRAAGATTCQGEGFVAVELLFLPGTYAPCPTCHGARYNPETLEVRYRGKSIADVLAHDRRRGGGVPRRRPGRGPQPGHAARRRARLPAARASRPPNCPAARRNGSSWRPSCSAPAAATPCTCSTSRPPACIRPTSSC